MVEAVIFDFDGPLFDGRRALEMAFEFTKNEFESIVGRPHMSLHGVPLMGPRRFISLMYAEFDPTPATVQEIVAFHAEQLASVEPTIGLQPGVLELVADLHVSSVPLAILTGRPDDEVLALLRHFDILHLFQEVVGRHSAPSSKPSPDGVNQIVRGFRLSHDQVLMVGDSDIDFEASRAANVEFILAGWAGEPGTVALRHPELVVQNPGDLGDILTRGPRLPLATTTIPTDLARAVADQHLSFVAGAGVSVPSGLGSWSGQYMPILRQLGVAWLAASEQFPEILQLATLNEDDEERLRTEFQTSFPDDCLANGFHFAMLRSGASRIWTSNYDDLFAQANRVASLGAKSVTTDATLLDNFQADQLVVKVNGDFTGARLEGLDEGVVVTQEHFDKADRARREIWRLFEDDFRNRVLVFVGLSFNDPVLRRIVALAAANIPQTLHQHYLLLRRPTDPIDAARQARVASNLKKYRIDTLVFDEYEDIQRFVSQLAYLARRPIIGISGNTRVDDADTEATSSDDVVLEDGRLNGAELRDLSSSIGAALATSQFRVTSGCAPYVGQDAVEAAFRVSPDLARFYIRAGGGRQYRKGAPAIIVQSDTSTDRYAQMRSAFIDEISVLIAIGGFASDRSNDGTEREINLALDRGAPVLMIPQAGGTVARVRQATIDRFEECYKDPALARAVLAANDAIAAITPSEAVETLPLLLANQVDAVVSVLMQSRADLRAAAAAWSAW